MGKNNCPTPPLYLVLSLVLSGLGLSGCGLKSTLPSIAPGTEIVIDIVDICMQDLAHPGCPDCVGLRESSQTEAWQTFSDPLGRFVFSYPADWYTMTVTPDPADGVRLMNAPSLEEATQWISLQIFPNPQRVSLTVWVAEQGVNWPGEIIDYQEEGQINGVPVLRQLLVNKNPETGGPFIYALLWYPLGENILQWTAWPGEITETLDLLDRIVHSFRISK